MRGCGAAVTRSLPPRKYRTVPRAASVDHGASVSNRRSVSLVLLLRIYPRGTKLRSGREWLSQFSSQSPKPETTHHQPVERQNTVPPYQGIALRSRKGWTATCNHTGGSRKHYAEWEQLPFDTAQRVIPCDTLEKAKLTMESSCVGTRGWGRGTWGQRQERTLRDGRKVAHLNTFVKISLMCTIKGEKKRLYIKWTLRDCPSCLVALKFAHKY